MRLVSKFKLLTSFSGLLFVVNWSVKLEYYCDKDKDKPVFFTSESNLMEEFMSINDISFTVRDFSLKKINIYLLQVIRAIDN